MTNKLPYSSEIIRGTNDIEVLRENYESLLLSYKNEISEKVKLEMQLENLELPLPL